MFHDLTNISAATATDISFIELELLFKASLKTNYKEFVYSGVDISQANVWENNTKTIKLFTKDIARVAGNITQITITDEITGVSMIKQLEYTIEGNIFSIDIQVN